MWFRRQFQFCLPSLSRFLIPKRNQPIALFGAAFLQSQCLALPMTLPLPLRLEKVWNHVREDDSSQCPLWTVTTWQLGKPM